MNSKQQEIIKGSVERIVFSNPETNFLVGRLRTEGGKHLITIVGNSFQLDCGQRVEVHGEWVFDQKYGKQFKISDIKILTPNTKNGIEKYLGSGLIKGIGPVMAKKIVSKFGMDTLKVLDLEPEKLNEIEGMGKKKIKTITEAWEKSKELREVMIFLKSYDISNYLAIKIYKNFGNESINVIKKNPYRLSEQIFGIGFKTADKIAQSVGIDKNSIFRVKAGIIYLLNDIENSGHCYYPLEDLLSLAADFLELDIGMVKKGLDELLKEDKIIIMDEFVKKVYLKGIYDAENYVCRKIKVINDYENGSKPANKKNIQEMIEKYSRQNNIFLDKIQKEAIIKAVINKILIITGSPGTGKSTILNFVIKILEDKNKKVILGAPTGRAAKRLNETSGKEAKTIHRMLKYNPRLNKFLKNENDPIEADVIVIDEASMIDIKLFENFLKAVKEDTSLILVGDVDQLPSVGPGNVLSDLIKSGIFEVIVLKKIYRQEGKSLIIYNAHRIRDGQFPYIKDIKSQDFFFIEKSKPENVVNLILNLITDKIPSKFNYDPLHDIQVLVPTNKGIVGVSNLNKEIQDCLNDNKLKISSGQYEYKLGDKVIQLKNDYEKDVYNGDIGFITNINLADKELLVDYDGRKVLYNFYELDEISLSYSISIHKSQGSEFNCAIIPILTSHYILLQRNLLYTAITRAKELAILVGSKKALGIAVNRNIVQDRYTGLKDMLSHY